MTARELIEKLQKAPPNAAVRMMTDDGWSDAIFLTLTDDGVHGVVTIWDVTAPKPEAFEKL